MPAGRQQQRYQPSGIITDIAPSAVGPEFWTGGHDVIFREHTERVRGLQQVFGEPLFPPEWALYSRDADEAPVWLYPATAGAAFFNGTVHADITPPNWRTPTIDNPWTGGVLNSIPVLGSGLYWYWDGAGLLQDLPDWPATRLARAMRPYKFHLIAMGITEGGTVLEDQVLWSSAAAPGAIPQEWTPAPVNEAGSTELAQTGGVCVDGAQLRSSFILYKDTSTYIMDYVGGSAVMATRLLFPDQGLLTRNCVAELGGNHFAMSDGDVYQHDGQVIRSAIDGVNRRALFRNISGQFYRNSFVVSNEKEGEVWVCVPEEGATYPSIAAVYNRQRDRWGLRDLPEQPSFISIGQVRLVPEGASWDDDDEAWEDDPSTWNTGGQKVDYHELLEVAPAADAFYMVDGAPTRLGEAVTAEVRKEMMPLGDPTRVKTVKSVWLELRGTPGTVLNVSMAGNLDETEAPVYGVPVPCEIGGCTKADLFVTGRYVSLLVTSSSAMPVEPWELVAFTLEFEPRGGY